MITVMIMIKKTKKTITLIIVSYNNNSNHHIDTTTNNNNNDLCLVLPSSGYHSFLWALYGNLPHPLLAL